MNIKPGLIITVRHYSLLNVFKAAVLEVQENTITIKLPKEALKATYIKGDPLVAAYETGDSIRITGGRLIDFDPKTEQFSFSVDQQDGGWESRSYERYPVSLYADFKLVEGGKKCFALVKDISEYGMLLYAKDSFFKGQRLNIDVFLTRDIMSLTAEIVRKVEHEDYIEYGLIIRHSGPTVFNHIKSFVKKAQEEHVLKFYKE
jgi:hypothetical protein